MLGQRDERIGWDQAAVGVLPADQGLDPAHVTGAQADLGLVVEDQLAPVHPATKISQQGEPFW